MMNGACRAFNARKLIFMSARFNDQLKRFLTQAYNVPVKKIMEFKPRLQIEGIEELGMELEHEAEINEKEDLLIEQMYERVEMEAQERPIIIF